MESVRLDYYFHTQDLDLCLGLVVLVHTAALYLSDDFEAFQRERREKEEERGVDCGRERERGTVM